MNKAFRPWLGPNFQGQEKSNHNGDDYTPHRGNRRGPLYDPLPNIMMAVQQTASRDREHTIGNLPSDVRLWYGFKSYRWILLKSSDVRTRHVARVPSV